MQGYFTPDERLQQKEKFDEHYRHMQSWGIREGKAFRWLKDVPRDARILECGSGSGCFSQQLIQAGFTNVHQSDFDDYVVYPEVRALNRFTKADLSFDRLPFDDNSFDFVIALQVLEHVENSWHAVREFKRILKNNGRCIISVPNADALPARMCFLFYHSPDPNHLPTNSDVNFFIPDLLHRLFGKGWHHDWTDYSTSFIKLSKKIKIRFPDKRWINKIFARRIAFGFTKNS